MPEAARLSQGNGRGDFFECAVRYHRSNSGGGFWIREGHRERRVDTEAINRQLIDALQKIVQCGDAGGATRDSRLATIGHIASTTLDTLSKEKGAGEPPASVDG